MNVTLRKIGNSEGVILPKEVLDRLNLRAGDKLRLAKSWTSIRLPCRSSPNELAFSVTPRC
jgi:putative addiction module antidote